MTLGTKNQRKSAKSVVLPTYLTLFFFLISKLTLLGRQTSESRGDGHGQVGWKDKSYVAHQIFQINFVFLPCTLPFSSFPMYSALKFCTFLCPLLCPYFWAKTRAKQRARAKYRGNEKGAKPHMSLFWRICSFW